MGDAVRAKEESIALIWALEAWLQIERATTKSNSVSNTEKSKSWLSLKRAWARSTTSGSTICSSPTRSMSCWGSIPW